MTTLYCGRCFHDRGVLQPLTFLTPIQISEKTGRPYDGAKKGRPYPYGCGFCGEERHDGGFHVRESKIITDKGEEHVVAHIPHVVAL